MTGEIITWLIFSYDRARTTVLNARLTKSVRNSGAIARRKMNEVDENGWAHIHQAAKKGKGL